MKYFQSHKKSSQFAFLVFVLINLLTEGAAKALKNSLGLREKLSKCDSDGPVIYSGSGNEPLFASNDTYEIVEGSNIFMKCRSTSPVELRYSSFMPNPSQSTLSTITQFNGIPCYEVSANLTLNLGVGKYECVNYDTDAAKSALIFANSNSTPSLFHPDVQLESTTIQGENQVTLPCISLIPSVQIKLFKDGNEISLQENVHYDPSQGFLFNISELENPFGTYQCLGEGVDDYNISISLNKPSARNNITFEYDEKEFRCLNTNKMILVPCNTPTECNFVRSCGNPVWSLTETCGILKQGVSPSRSINNNKGEMKVIKRNEDNGGLKNAGGLIFCSNKHNTQEFSFFTDLHGTLVSNLTESGLKNGTFMTMNPVDFEWNTMEHLYTYENFSVECKVSKLIFTDAIQWKYQLKNGSLVDPHIISDKTIYEYNYYSKRSVLRIEDATAVNILCTAGRINSIKSGNISHHVKIIGSVLELVGKNESWTFESTKANPNPVLSCTATGIPLPTFTWYKNGEELQHIDRSTKVEKNTLTSSIELKITLESVNKSDVYYCNATNCRGTQLRYITLLAKSESPGPSSNNGLDWAVGIAVLVILLVFSISFLVYIRIKMKVTLEDFTQEDIDEFMKGNNSTVEANTITTDYWSVETLPYLPSSEIADADKNLIIEEILGKGFFGVVHKGRLNIEGVETIVAVKSTMPNPSKQVFKDFLAELKLMQHVGQHDNVVKLIGSVTKDIAEKKALIVVEICELNNLKDFMLAQRSTFRSEFQRPPTPPILASHYSSASAIQPAPNPVYSQMGLDLRTSHLIQWSYEIASGMEFLSSKKIVHRDLAARNILLNSQLVAKITDFGLSRNLYDSIYYAVPKGQERKLPLRWLSIEGIKHMKFSVESDIWAFGVVMFEIFTLGDDPMESVPDKLILPFLEENSRMEKPRFANNAIYNIMLKCWDKDCSKRPRFRQLKEEIDNTRNTLGQLDEEQPSNYIEVGHFDSEDEYCEKDDYENDNDAYV